MVIKSRASISLPQGTHTPASIYPSRARYLIQFFFKITFCQLPPEARARLLSPYIISLSLSHSYSRGGKVIELKIYGTRDSLRRARARAQSQLKNVFDFSPPPFIKIDSAHPPGAFRVMHPNAPKAPLRDRK